MSARSLVALTLALIACAATAPYSEPAYLQAVTLRQSSLALIEHAGEPYNLHQAEADTVLAGIERARLFAIARGHDSMAARQWALLVDRRGHLLGGFLARWAAEDTLSTTFIEESGLVVAEAFAAIERLELGRRR